MRRRRVVRTSLKRLANGVSLALVSPCALTSWVEERVHPGGEAVFNFWTQVFAAVPGYIGLYLRRSFYRLTLDRAPASFFIGFGAMFTHRRAVVGDGAYVGAYALVGSVRLGEGCLIGSRVSILSGSRLHEMGEDGRWTPYHPSRLRQVEIGDHAWIGEGAVIMADVGARAMVAAGTVVSAPIPPAVVVAGNPARYVRPVRPGEPVS